MFSRIQAPRRYLQIADQILERIKSGELASGSQLPPERELAAQMGVSRPTVREALIALELLRVVEIRIGQGTYVIGDAHISLDNIAQSGVIAPFDLLEARMVIESNTVACSAGHWRNATGNEEGFRQSLAICDMMEEFVHDSTRVQEFYRLGLEFHKVLATCSGNEVLENIIRNLVDASGHPLWELINRKILEDEHARQYQIDEHRRILQSIRTGDGEAAAKEMSGHLSHLMDFSLS